MIFSIIEFIPSIGPFDNLLGFPLSSRQSFIVIKEFKMYSIQVDKVFATSINGSNFELKNFSIKSFNCSSQFVSLATLLNSLYSSESSYASYNSSSKSNIYFLRLYLFNHILSFLLYLLKSAISSKSCKNK